MNDLVIELPHLNLFSGGIIRSLDLAEELSKQFKVHIRIQKLKDSDNPEIKLDYSVGLPSQQFPKSKYIITYSDNPFTEDLIKYNKDSKIFVLMLSYGMCLERERKNALNESLTVLTSTRRTEKLINEDGGKCHYISFAYTNTDFYQEKCDKENIAVIYYAWQPDKNYKLAVKICNELFKQKLIKGCISFGINICYDKFEHPICLLEHHSNANKDEIRRIFSRSSIFIMPSRTEGLNRTPIEATLCGCPSVICDGAIGDVFFDNKTCLIAKPDFEDVLEKSERLILNIKYQVLFMKNMKKILKNYTLQNVVSNLKKLL